MDAFPPLCMNADPSDRGLHRLLPVTQPGPFSFENRASAKLRLPPAAHNRPCSTLMTRGPLSDCYSNRRRYSNVRRAPTSAGPGFVWSFFEQCVLDGNAIHCNPSSQQGGGRGGREEAAACARRGTSAWCTSGRRSLCVCVCVRTQV